MSKTNFKAQFLEVSIDLAEKLNKFQLLNKKVTIYNPLSYARKMNEVYVDMYLNKDIEAIFLGMNPGPFGMAQTGIPFGDVEMVRDWLKIEGDVMRPKYEHPKRPITGFACKKREVSGTRLWSWAKQRYSDPEKFFKKFFVWNYCPLVFMEESGANKTPDKLSLEERSELFGICDLALKQLVEITHAKSVIGVGKFARKRAENAMGEGFKVSDILHPSPASPKANKNWVGEVERQLEEIGLL